MAQAEHLGDLFFQLGARLFGVFGRFGAGDAGGQQQQFVVNGAFGIGAGVGQIGVRHDVAALEAKSRDCIADAANIPYRPDPPARGGQTVFSGSLKAQIALLFG